MTVEHILTVVSGLAFLGLALYLHLINSRPRARKKEHDNG